jgi:hypothetical protein
MTKNIGHPFVITGLVTIVFAGVVLLDALLSLAWAEAAIGLVLIAGGWLLRSRGGSEISRRWTWLRFLAIVLPALPLLYVSGYFVLMNRSRPTDPLGEIQFQSSLRGVHYSRGWGRWRPYPEVTVFNLIFRPADKVYFTYFPRSDEEIERLRALGYFR